MFLDEVVLQVKSGKGGDGIIAFRREKHVPLGGPSGGDGGKGGSVIFEADEGLSTLYDLKYMKHVRAKAGENGKIKDMRGADAEDVIVKVPVGTTVFNLDDNRVICDLVQHGEQAIIAKGGKGGRGNSAFASSRNKAPRIQENGDPSQIVDIRVELKLLADVGIIGFPSVGKSTIISSVSGSRPKIADYPFTTIIPNLGVVSLDNVKSFVLADMPGLIEGASQGLGLGIQFLKHIERTRVLLHVIDMSLDSTRDPYQDYITINNELSTYKFQLSKRPQIVVANKMDTEGADERLAEFKKQYHDDFEIVEISALTKKGLTTLMQKASLLLEQTKQFSLYEETEIPSELIVEFEKEVPSFEVIQIDEHTYEVVGEAISRLYQRSNFMTDEAVMKFISQLRKLGVDNALRKAGAKDTDMVKIIDFEFEFVE
ncbi:MAG: GTPase ObgE [Firmicutes bacterium]|nr:GTPase ObgE [Bacillota bacterium]